MDARVNDDFDRRANGSDYENFLLDEGLEVLATYRSIKDEDVRLAIRQLIASLAKTSLLAE